MPHNVNRYHINTGNHGTQQQGITNLLADFNFLVAVEQREQNHGKQTAVNFRFALYVYRVILCRQQLRQQIDQIEAVLDTPGHIRFGEVEFTKLQGAVNRQQHKGRTHQRNAGAVAESYNGHAVIPCLHMLPVFSKDQIEDKIQCGEDGNHVADVEV